MAPAAGTLRAGSERHSGGTKALRWPQGGTILPSLARKETAFLGREGTTLMLPSCQRLSLKSSQPGLVGMVQHFSASQGRDGKSALMRTRTVPDISTSSLSGSKSDC